VVKDYIQKENIQEDYIQKENIQEDYIQKENNNFLFMKIVLLFLIE